MNPRIVALGGGHGLYATLSAARRLTPHVTAIVTVADDGGSSGRLRNELDVLPPGDLRMALAALASDSPQGRLWATIIQHRFGGNGALAGHPIGNLMLAGLERGAGRSGGGARRTRPHPRHPRAGVADVSDGVGDRGRRRGSGIRSADEPGDPRPGGDRHHRRARCDASGCCRGIRRPPGRRWTRSWPPTWWCWGPGRGSPASSRMSWSHSWPRRCSRRRRAGRWW